MKKSLAFFMAAAMLTPSAFAAEITPYVGVSLVIDKAGTSAKRVGFDPSRIKVDMGQLQNGIPAMISNAMGSAIVQDGGGDMKFDMAMAGEISAGIKWGNWRAELQAALRGASEDAYDIFDGAFDITPIPNMPISVGVDANIATSTSVRHNSYLANFYYDIDINSKKWMPYVGAGLGVGVYKQTATVDASGIATGTILPDGPIEFGQSMTVLDQTKTVFEWQLAAGALYSFNENWGIDIAYRFNSATIAGEFVYAHELKLGARYSF